MVGGFLNEGLKVLKFCRKLDVLKMKFLIEFFSYI